MNPLKKFFSRRSRNREILIEMLCRDIQENRRLIGKLRGAVHDLESRLWKLENHGIEETLDEVKSQIDAWSKEAEQWDHFKNSSASS